MADKDFPVGVVVKWADRLWYAFPVEGAPAPIADMAPFVEEVEVIREMTVEEAEAAANRLADRLGS